MNACTIVASNYLAHARVLAGSFLSHHPEGRFSVLLLDDQREEFRSGDEPFRLVRPRDVMDERAFDRLSLLYDVTELATAVKPWFLEYLLNEARSASSEVLFFDPDVRIFDRLDDVAQLARRHSIVLTPHDTEPVPHDGLQPSELQMLQSGVFNLGFLALGRGSERFLSWWEDRLRLHCLASPPDGLFVDQKWIDFVPGYFDHYILKDPGCNVAYWNLSSRSVTFDGARYRVNGGPLRFFHFSGFTPERPHVLSRHSLPAPRVLLSEHKAVKHLCDAYARELLDRGYEAVSRRPYGLSELANGLPIERRMRRAYRDALLAFERGKGDEPPLGGGEADAFVRWLNEPIVRSPFASVSRYLHALYVERPDLRSAFPRLAGPDGARFLRWVRETGVREAGIPEPLLPGDGGVGPLARPDSGLLPGVNVVGYFRAEMGVGEAARQLVSAIERAGIPHATLTVEDTRSRQDHPFQNRSPEAPYDIHVICVNADALPGVAETLGPDFFEGRYRIGVWHWEVPSFPERWRDAFQYVDEVWVASEHVALALSPVSPRPVLVVPPPIALPPVPSATRRELGIPDRFAFLFTYDFLSVCERKNPLALIDAFRRAFAPGEGPVLVLKSINGDQRIEALERVKLAAAEHGDVLVLDRYLSREATIGLAASCDCYVSLHRAEGFGLTIAEAMALGKPVVATAYSGNLEFMRNDNSYLVRYRLVPIPEGFEPYGAGDVWAEPDVEHASELMRHVYRHPDEARERGRRAREDLARDHGIEARSRRIGERLAEIRRARRPPALESGAPPAAPEPEPAPEEAAPLPSKHERAHRLAREFPGSPWGGTSRFRPALPMARDALLRLLRPYTASLQTLHAAILDDALEIRERFDRHERERVPALEGALGSARSELLERMRALEARLELLAGQTLPAIYRESREGQDRAAARLEELEERTERRFEALEQRVRIVEERLALSLEHHDAVKRHLAELAGDVTGFQDAARAHLASLTERTGALGDALERLQRELHSLPYTAEPFRLRIEGEEAMAFRRESGERDASFELVFRGPEEAVRDRLRPYLDLARAHPPVLDVGCGRGEFLDLLADSGIPGAGVDSSPGMVERCRQKGRRVELADALEYLAAQPDGSIGCIFSAQFVEHLSEEAFRAFLRLSWTKLVPGGVLVAETVNPHSVAAMKHFWVDLSHEKPIFPEVALALTRLQGFATARIVFPRGSGRLSDDLWTEGEYAVVAVRD
jgi:glycosyltransferase involved in cell wall biosynthesis/SAM-dependent methyltransferase